MIWVVVPFSRPNMLGNVLGNACRQTVPFKLVLVENGPAVGTCKRHGIAPALLLTSEPHQAIAKNTALAEIRKRGGGLVALWDDDDYYGAGFLAELVANRRRATVVGKRIHWVELADGLYLFDHESANQPSTLLHGPTVMAQASEIVDFPVVSPSDDRQWCKAMRQAGATMWATSVGEYVYRRTGSNHVWNASDLLVRFQLGDSYRFDADGATFVPGLTDEQIFEALDSGSFCGEASS
jgi:hypothetical protein